MSILTHTRTGMWIILRISAQWWRACTCSCPWPHRHIKCTLHFFFPATNVRCICDSMSAYEGHPHRHRSWGLHSLRRPRGGWRCRGSCSLPPAWSSWPSWPLRWLRWQLLPPPLSGLERGGRGDSALTDHYMSAGAEPLHLQNLSKKKKASLANKKKRGTFEIIKQWIILYTMGNKLLRDHDFVFHLLTGDIFTAGYHADEMDPRVCGSIWFLWMFQRLRHSSPLYWCIRALMGKDAVKITVHDASTLCVQLIIVNEEEWCGVTQVGVGGGGGGSGKEKRSVK